MTLWLLLIPFAALFSLLLTVLHLKKGYTEDVPLTPPMPPTPVVTSNREKLYDTAKACIGRDMSPQDIAPDSLACAESLNGVFKEAFGEDIKKGVVSTEVLYHALLNDSRFILIAQSDILPGDISLAVTGQSAKGAPHGHVGIWGKETVMSNDSSSGLWKANYTLAAWPLVFEKTLGFPLHAFRVV